MDHTTHPAKHTDTRSPEKTVTHVWGTFLKKARRSRGMSQRALARELGVSQARIAQIENGASTPQIDTIAAYITALGGEDGRTLYLAMEHVLVTGRRGLTSIVNHCNHCGP